MPYLPYVVYLAIFLFVAGCAGFYLLRRRSKGTESLSLANIRSARKQSEPTRKQTWLEKRITRQAQHFIKKGNGNAAAKLFESIGSTREALTALETLGQIDEAANILIRGRNFQRAAVLYARYAMWPKAKDCYRMANMSLEAAKAAREGGEFEVAIELFEKANRLDLAAETSIAMGNLHRAARLFATAGKREEAVKLYRQMSDSTAHQAGLNLEDSEIKIIIDYVTSGNHDKVFTDLLVKRNKLVEVILHLLTEARMEEATELYIRANADIGPTLISEVSFASQAAERLGEMFLRVQQHFLAGELYERLGSYERAAQYFEKADDKTRAASCYRKAGRNDRIDVMASAIGIDATQLASVNLGTEKKYNRDVARLMGQYEVNESQDPPSDVSFNDRLPAFSDAVMMNELRSSFYWLPLFEELEFHHKSLLWEMSCNRDFEARQVILDFGKEADGLYVVLKGQIGCLRIQHGREQQVDQMGIKESFGELWLLTEMTSTVKFVALSATTIRVIPRNSFLGLMDKDGTLARKLYKNFTKSLLRRLLIPQNNSEKREAS